MSNGSVDPLPPAVITGLFFEDLNGNRTLDPGEPGVSGVKATFTWFSPTECPDFPIATNNCRPELLAESILTGPDGRFRSEIDFNGRPAGFACNGVLSSASAVDTALLFSTNSPLSPRVMLGFTAQNGQPELADPCFHPGEVWETKPSPMVRP